MTASTFDEAESVFFADPTTLEPPPGAYGVLFLLRRDIQRCLDHDILWPAAIAVLVGVDLLGKFLAGEDEIGLVGSRFKGFVKEYFHLSESHQGAMYDLRNAWLHSFGLYSGESRLVIIASEMAPFVVEGQKNEFFVSLPGLHAVFEQAIAEYRNDLRASPNLQVAFLRMFEKYGQIGIIDQGVSP